jgi:hypothetical protein
VKINPENDLVFFEIMSYSKASGFLGFIALFLIRPLQKKFLNDNAKSFSDLMKK